MPITVPAAPIRALSTTAMPSTVRSRVPNANIVACSRDRSSSAICAVLNAIRSASASAVTWTMTSRLRYWSTRWRKIREVVATGSTTATSGTSNSSCWTDSTVSPLAGVALKLVGKAAHPEAVGLVVVHERTEPERNRLDAGNTDVDVAVLELAAVAVRRADADQIARLDAELLRARLGQKDLGRLVAAGHACHSPVGHRWAPLAPLEVDEPEGQVELAPVVVGRTAEHELGIHPVDDPRRTQSGPRRLGWLERDHADRESPVVALHDLLFPDVDGAEHRVRGAGGADEGRDRRGDADRCQQGAARRAQHVAERHLCERPPGTRSHATSGAKPLPRALMNPVRIASIGGTVTARQTG